MPDGFGAIVLGIGPGGEVAVSRLIDGGREVAVAERELVGGACAYWACIRSKNRRFDRERSLERPRSER